MDYFDEMLEADGRRSRKDLGLNQDQRDDLKRKVKRHSIQRKLLHSRGDKAGASFHEGCMKMAQQILEEFI